MEAVDGYQQVLYGQDVSWLLQEGSYSCLLSLCQGIVDVTYKQSRRHSAPAGQVKGIALEPLHTGVALKDSLMLHNIVCVCVCVFSAAARLQRRQETFSLQHEEETPL